MISVCQIVQLSIHFFSEMHLLEVWRQSCRRSLRRKTIKEKGKQNHQGPTNTVFILIGNLLCDLLRMKFRTYNRTAAWMIGNVHKNPSHSSKNSQQIEDSYSSWYSLLI